MKEYLDKDESVNQYFGKKRVVNGSLRCKLSEDGRKNIVNKSYILNVRNYKNVYLLHSNMDIDSNANNGYNSAVDVNCMRRVATD